MSTRFGIPVTDGVGDDEYAVAAGDFVGVSGDREVAPTAVEDATAVVTFAPQQD